MNMVTMCQLQNNVVPKDCRKQTFHCMGLTKGSSLDGNKMHQLSQRTFFFHETLTKNSTEISVFNRLKERKY